MIEESNKELQDIVAGTGTADQLTIKRLKKRKLLLKDTFTNLESKLIPNLLA